MLEDHLGIWRKISEQEDNKSQEICPPNLEVGGGAAAQGCVWVVGGVSYILLLAVRTVFGFSLVQRSLDSSTSSFTWTSGGVRLLVGPPQTAALRPGGVAAAQMDHRIQFAGTD